MLMPRRVNSIQAGRTPEVAAAERDRIYWDELARMTRGTARLRRDALRALGVVPLIRLGPLEGDRRPILGGFLAAAPGGTLGWEHEAGETRVALRGFAPRLPPPLYRLQDAVHRALSARYLRRLAAVTGSTETRRA
jgi:hypothetical protein